jgi:hypothetical protein
MVLSIYCFRKLLNAFPKFRPQCEVYIQLPFIDDAPLKRQYVSLRNISVLNKIIQIISA